MSRPRGTRARASDPLSGLTPLVLAAIAVAMLMWTTGTVAALVLHHHMPHAGLVTMGAITLRLLTNPGYPAAAWPTEDQQLIPGPAGFYLTFALLCGVAITLLLVGWRLTTRITTDPRGPRGPGATWASRRDLRDLNVRPGDPLVGRIVLGRTPWGRTIATPPRHSLLVFGPTLSFKTRGIVIPTILRWRGPVIATSVKPDLLRATLEVRQERGHTYLLDPFGASGLPGIRWSPLVGAHTWADALDMAFWLTQAAAVSRTVQNAEFWETLARALLAPMLYAAANTPGGSMLDVVAWTNDYQLAEQILLILDTIEADDPTDPGPRLARSALLAGLQAEPRRKDSIFGTAQVLLDVYKYPAVAHTAQGCDIDRDQFLRGVDNHGQPIDNTVMVFAPEHRQDQLRPLFEAFLSWLIRGAEDHHAHTGLPLDPPLLVMLDEAANIAPLRRLDTYASTLASQGVQLVAVFQDLAQLKHRYGNQANTILTNFLAKILMAGTTDRDLLDLLTHLLGKQETPEESTTHNADGTRTTMTTTRQHDLAPIHTLVQQPPGHALALLSHRPPVRLRIRPDLGP
jgi:type IV secretion system protein VirD4